LLLRLLPRRLRVRAAFFAAVDRRAFLAARVRAALRAAVERFEDLRVVALRPVVLRRLVLRAIVDFFLRRRPVVAIVIPPELAVSLGDE
jgi:hypothetical protein